MKKTLILVLFSLAGNSLFAQWENKFKVGGFGGYEHNIFLSPSTLIRDGEQLFRTDLLTSGFFEGVGFNGDLERKVKDGRLKITFNTSMANFHTSPDADRFILNLKSSYRKRYRKGKYFEVAPAFSRRSQQGINESDGVLRTTFSYTRFNLPVHLDYYLGNKAWFKTETGYIFKAYDQNDLGEKVTYHATYTGFGISKKWNRGETVSKVTFSGRVEYRQYTDLEVDDEDEAEEEGEENEVVARPGNPIAFIAEERQWFFYKTSVEYNVKNSTSNFDYTLGLYFVGRGDSEGRFGYSELSPGMKMGYKMKKASLSASVKYSLRNFTTLEIGEEDNGLRYRYFRANLKLNVPLTKKRSWYIQGNLTNRVTNNTGIESTAFRGYLNSAIETGITFRF